MDCLSAVFQDYQDGSVFSNIDRSVWMPRCTDIRCPLSIQAIDLKDRDVPEAERLQFSKNLRLLWSFSSPIRFKVENTCCLTDRIDCDEKIGFILLIIFVQASLMTRPLCTRSLKLLLMGKQRVGKYENMTLIERQFDHIYWTKRASWGFL